MFDKVLFVINNDLLYPVSKMTAKLHKTIINFRCNI